MWGKNFLMVKELDLERKADRQTAYDDGAMGLIPVFKKLGIDCSYYTTEENRKADCLCIRRSVRKSMEHVKKKRKQLRATRKGFADKKELEEGETYGYGQF